jgi:2-oxoisovalerate dehydrogenase E1 component
VLFVDECRRAGNVGEAVIAELACLNQGFALDLLSAQDSYVPLGDAATLVLPSEAQIIERALTLCRNHSRRS